MDATLLTMVTTLCSKNETFTYVCFKDENVNFSLTIVRDFIADVLINKHWGFMCPASRYISHCVSTSTKHHQGYSEIFNEFDAFSENKETFYL